MVYIRLETPISDCNFTNRTQTILESVGIKYFEELCNMYNSNILRENVLSWMNAGRTTLKEIEAVIHKHSGYRLEEKKGEE